jgi:hypothetical protein
MVERQAMTVQTVATKVRYTCDYYKVSLIKGNVYDVLSIEHGWHRIVDETGEDYLFSPDDFEIAGALT